MATGAALTATTTTQRWEYLYVPLDNAGGPTQPAAGWQPARLNKLALQGWELASLQRGDLVTPPLVLLRRPVGSPSVAVCPGPGRDRCRRSR